MPEAMTNEPGDSDGGGLEEAPRDETPQSHGTPVYVKVDDFDPADVLRQMISDAAAAGRTEDAKRYRAILDDPSEHEGFLKTLS